jgi:hypothetical protein
VSYTSWCSVQNVKIMNLYLEEGKFKNLRKGVQKNAVSLQDVSVIWWKGQGDIQSGSYTVYLSRGEGMKCKCESNVPRYKRLVQCQLTYLKS